jgi:LacI family transcriptional regulator
VRYTLAYDCYVLDSINTNHHATAFTLSHQIIMSVIPSRADRRSRLRDVAQVANVSMATVDRVLNNRGKVRQLTAQRVLAAAEQVKYVPASELLGSAQKKVGVLGVVIPAGPYHFFRKLELAFERLKERAVRQGITILIRTPPHQDWEAIVKFLQNDAQLFDAVALIAGDHPVVLEAVNAYRRQGKGVICIVSDLPSSARQSFIGIDNQAAGKTAARLLSEFARSGSIGLLTGSLQQRDHQERLLGFRSSLETLAPAMRIVGIKEALDKEDVCYQFTKNLIEQHSDLSGIYHSGADMTGIVRAIQEPGYRQNLVVIGHELTDSSRQFLAHGMVTAILNQDASFMAERTVATFADLLERDLPAHRVYQLGAIEIFLRENLPPPAI